MQQHLPSDKKKKKIKLVKDEMPISVFAVEHKMLHITMFFEPVLFKHRYYIGNKKQYGYCFPQPSRNPCVPLKTKEKYT